MKLSHIGIAVRDLGKAELLFRTLLGNGKIHHEEVVDQAVRIASFDLDGSRIELTEPMNDDSPISKFLTKRGEGIHHIAFEVNDVAAELARLKRDGVELIDEKPRLGSHGMLIAFLHPKSTNGVLIELCQNGTLLPRKEGE
ncbi:MAG: methylmalonyl-CoA epimerase [Bacteroidota bacterium]|nr:methylmalonyl-CoA epimerase [Bacteroidota bacterium]MDP4234539.1 methylmalonyl-CoA epimerase [Bacteroidota bacterium]MDP4242604.1 methylmalonyl-CoA epimerase [Bacteroidota bacterium]MDP4289180.1 methylmalonyl-CoA epimerase [Bacteroidota bacterium]